MLYNYTLNEIESNINTGVEYEIALFYLLSTNETERSLIMQSIEKRIDSEKVKSIINRTTTNEIYSILNHRGLTLIDCSFETQNDNVGPADIVLHVINNSKEESRIGLSVKYANNCTLNVTGRRFITEEQIKVLREQLKAYTDLYIKEMTQLYGDVSNWFRKRKPSKTTDQFIDLIRDAVILNWTNIPDKEQLLEDLYQSSSPIEYWVFKYTSKSFEINEHPFHLSGQLAREVRVDKMETSYVAFYLRETRIGHMQVKFNNGFVEKCKKMTPDFIVEGVPMSYGQPFSSWNFSIEN